MKYASKKQFSFLFVKNRKKLKPKTPEALPKKEAGPGNSRHTFCNSSGTVLLFASKKCTGRQLKQKIQVK